MRRQLVPCPKLYNVALFHSSNELLGKLYHFFMLLASVGQKSTVSEDDLKMKMTQIMMTIQKYKNDVENADEELKTISIMKKTSKMKPTSNIKTTSKFKMTSKMKTTLTMKTSSKMKRNPKIKKTYKIKMAKNEYKLKNKDNSKRLFHI